MPDLTRVCVCVCVCLIEHSGTPHASRPPRHLNSRGLDRKRAARKQQVINTTGTVWLCDRCSRQDLLITDWALRPSAYPPIGDAIRRIRRCTPCLCVCVCVCVCVLAVAGPGVGDIRAADECLRSDRHDPAARSVAAAVRTMSSDARRRRCKGTSRHCSTVN